MARQETVDPAQESLSESEGGADDLDDGEGEEAIDGEESEASTGDKDKRRKRRRPKRGDIKWNREMTRMLLIVLAMLALPLAVVGLAVALAVSPKRATVEIDTSALRGALEDAADRALAKPTLRDNMIELAIDPDRMVALGAKLEISAQRMGGNAMLLPLSPDEKGLRYLVTLPVGMRDQLETILTTVGPPPAETHVLEEGAPTELLEIRLRPADGRPTGAKAIPQTQEQLPQQAGDAPPTDAATEEEIFSIDIGTIPATE